MSRDSIALAPDITRYFEQAVHEAIRVRQVDTTPTAVQYVVGLLCDYARPDRDATKTFDRPLTLLLREALDTAGAERFHQLRSLGDGVLYVLGFFAASLTRRGADRGYAIGVGVSAYGHASAMLRMASNSPTQVDVLGELAQGFARFVDVLSEVADAAAAASAKDDAAVLRLYERWRETGSQRLALRLGALGLSASSRPRGVQ